MVRPAGLRGGGRRRGRRRGRRKKADGSALPRMAIVSRMGMHLRRRTSACPRNGRHRVHTPEAGGFRCRRGVHSGGIPPHRPRIQDSSRSWPLPHGLARLLVNTPPRLFPPTGFRSADNRCIHDDRDTAQFDAVWSIWQSCSNKTRKLGNIVSRVSASKIPAPPKTTRRQKEKRKEKKTQHTRYHPAQSRSVISANIAPTALRASIVAITDSSSPRPSIPSFVFAFLLSQIYHHPMSIRRIKSHASHCTRKPTFCIRKKKQKEELKKKKTKETQTSTAATCDVFLPGTAGIKHRIFWKKHASATRLRFCGLDPGSCSGQNSTK